MKNGIEFTFQALIPKLNSLVCCSCSCPSGSFLSFMCPQVVWHKWHDTEKNERQARQKLTGIMLKSHVCVQSEIYTCALIFKLDLAWKCFIRTRVFSNSYIMQLVVFPISCLLKMSIISLNIKEHVCTCRLSCKVYTVHILLGTSHSFYFQPSQFEQCIIHSLQSLKSVIDCKPGEASVSLNLYCYFI